MSIPTELKSVLDEIRTLATNNPELAKIQRQVDAIDVKLTGGARLFGGGPETKSLYELFDEDDSIKRLLSDKKGRAVITLEGVDALALSRKATLTEVAAGSSVSGVLPIGRLDGITTEARQQLTIRDLLTATPTTFQVVDFVKVNSPMANASPVAEASLKAEQAVTFTTVSARVKTIASWLPASRQILDDLAGVVSFIQNSLVFYLNQEEEQQILSGDNVGEDLHGLIPQAPAFNAGQLVASKGWNKIDIIGRAVQQITSAKLLSPTFVVLNPNDWWDIRLTKDGFGRYILGDPQQGAMPQIGFGGLDPSQNLFGLNVVPTTNIALGTFLVGSGSPVACEIMDRMETQVDISTEHSTFFTQNLVAISAEKRLCLITRRPGSFVTGTFNTSP